MSDENSFFLGEVFVKVKVAKLISTQMKFCIKQDKIPGHLKGSLKKYFLAKNLYKP